MARDSYYNTLGLYKLRIPAHWQRNPPLCNVSLWLQSPLEYGRSDVISMVLVAIMD